MGNVDPVVESKDWSAWENHQPPGPVSFHVKGTVVVIATNYGGKLEKAVPQGTNPKILLLNLSVEETDDVGGDAITDLEVRYLEENFEPGTYDQVTIVRDGNGGAQIDRIDTVH